MPTSHIQPEDLRLEYYDYDLPQENIAQHPAFNRDTSKLLIFNRRLSVTEHTTFSSITKLFNKGDILVVNNTKVFLARLIGKKDSGGKAEVFLLELPSSLEKSDPNTLFFEAVGLIKSSRRPAAGSIIHISENLTSRVTEHLKNARVRVELSFPASFDLQEILAKEGSIPLPPYIERSSGTT